MYEYNATVLNVIDGDTCRLDVDLGFSIFSKQVVRLNGINAPELHGQPDPAPGRAAKAHLESLLPVGTCVRITTEKDKREKYGRLLALIYVGGVCVNAEMIKAGHAKAYDGGVRVNG